MIDMRENPSIYAWHKIGAAVMCSGALWDLLWLVKGGSRAEFPMTFNCMWGARMRLHLGTTSSAVILDHLSSASFYSLPNFHLSVRDRLQHLYFAVHVRQQTCEYLQPGNTIMIPTYLPSLATARELAIETSHSRKARFSPNKIIQQSRQQHTCRAYLHPGRV